MMRRLSGEFVLRKRLQLQALNCYTAAIFLPRQFILLLGEKRYCHLVKWEFEES
jgi:hypothetical protein